MGDFFFQAILMSCLVNSGRVKRTAMQDASVRLAAAQVESWVRKDLKLIHDVAPAASDGGSHQPFSELI